MLTFDTSRLGGKPPEKPKGEGLLGPAICWAAWRDVKSNEPPLQEWKSGQGWSEKQYVLAVDAKGRMSIAYAYRHSANTVIWTMAKPIGAVTHWMPLPEPPNAGADLQPPPNNPK